MATRIKNSVLNLRVTEETKERIKELAAADNRTITGWLENTIKIEYEKTFKEKRRG